MMKQQLAKGSHGAPVRAVQNALNQAKIPNVMTGFYCEQTEAAVRRYQACNGLLPDGVAGPKTLSTMGLGNIFEGRPVGVSQLPAATPVPKDIVSRNLDDVRTTHGLDTYLFVKQCLTKRQPPFGGEHTHTALAMSTSKLGKEFIYRSEITKDTPHLHWPHGLSGVTLGAGYDMRYRTAKEITNDLVKIGIDLKVAEQVAKGAKLSGKAAHQFAKDHIKLIELTDAQQMSLLELVLPEYERRVKNVVTVDLLQHQFDALVSYTYNAGSIDRPLLGLINGRNFHGAEVFIRDSAKGAKPEVRYGLGRRRERERVLFGTGEYNSPAASKQHPSTKTKAGNKR